MSERINRHVSCISGDVQWMAPVQLGLCTVLNVARAPETLESVLGALGKLEADPFLEFSRDYYLRGRQSFGAAWGYVDQLTVLHAAATLLKPETYLEIGTFRGRSISVVAAAAPRCRLFSFDLWVPGYAGIGSEGPEHVRGQLDRVGHAGERTFVSGNSLETVPRFFEENPDLFLDLVTVDGDHGEEGARRDLLNVIEHITVGGMLVFDDIAHPKHPWLERVWDEVVGEHPDYLSGKFTEVGHGVAFAIRRAIGVARGEKAGHAAKPSPGKALVVEQAARIGELTEYVDHLEQSYRRVEKDSAERLSVIERDALRLRELAEEVRHLRSRNDQAVGLLLDVRRKTLFRAIRFFRQWSWLDQGISNLVRGK
jgi:predicted O-methyltransferase YrrM